MRTAIDTNILIVLLRGQPALQAQHVAEVIAAHDRLGQLCISPLVWSELTVLLDKDKINTFLKDNRIQVDWELGPEIWSTASAAFRKYHANRRRSGSLYFCSFCGGEVRMECPECNKRLGFPRHILPDFLISAHALHRAGLLITADRGIPQRYFTDLKVLNPLL